MAQDKYSVSVIESIHDWEGIREQWNDLLAKSRSNNIFLTFEWLFSWWIIYSNSSRKLLLLYVHNDDTLVGIAPWHINNIRHGLFNQRRLEFIGTPEAGSDYLDVICMEGEEINVANALYRYLHDVFMDWDTLFLHDFPAESMFFMNFISELCNDGKYFNINTASYCPAMNLPGNIEEFKSNMTSKNLKKLNYMSNKLTRKGEFAVEGIACDGNEKYIIDFFDFYERVRNIKADKLRMFLEYYNKYVGNKSTINILTLRQGDNVLASILHLIYGRKIYNFLVATDKNYLKNTSVGEILVYETIIYSIRENYNIYDFLKGEEPYKFKWANDGRRSLTMTYRKLAFVNIYLLLIETVKNIAKYIIR